MKILIADDEPHIRRLICDFFRPDGYTMLEAADGREALDVLAEHPDCALVILDVMMPRLDGWTVLREIRKHSDVPVMMLTARSEEFDQLHGFEIGADDYVTKPFSPSVLLARVNARLKKNAHPGKRLVLGDLTVDTERHSVVLAGTELELSPKEYELLVFLASHAGRVYSREQLLYQIWGFDYFGGERTVDTHIGRLRLKLNDTGETYIKTVRGYGYKFDAPAKEES